jgi:hypothetical protein
MENYTPHASYGDKFLELKQALLVITHRMENLETNQLNLINSSLEIIYCSMTLSNRSIIRFILPY